MKNTLIIYDSVFGNTAKIARAMANALQEHLVVDLRIVGEVLPEHLDGFKTLIVGSPTRRFKATNALDQFLKQIPAGGLSGVQIAAFDTRLIPEEGKKNIFLALVVKLFGYADKKISRQLVQLGGTEIIPSQGFMVNGIEGPLREGELEKAAAWAVKTIQNI
ncbi:MAG: flavodoxin domain-containing protein [Anaerolineaceae bacterium]|jgi:flavodoxin|nr:flavodoxin domain-containing protein [Anaerolineaceae bacterium]